MFRLQLVDALVQIAGVPPGQDVMGNLTNFWKDITTTGKLGAAIFGFVLGFMLRGLTR
jgi:tetrahydromethanopterin S-methyltransferase subunit B